MHDSNNKGAFLIRREEANSWNEQGYGIFWTVNEFRNGKRRIEELERIRSWAIDMDEGTKQEMRAKLNRSPLVPSLVVETKRGFQAYWNAKDAKPERWNDIVLNRLVRFFGADPNARDLARILRVPGFNHLKDPADPFLVQTEFMHQVSYSEAQMLSRFPNDAEAEAAQRKKHEAVKREIRFADSDRFWDRVYNLDCVEGLSRLSGHPAVGGEQYTFRRNASGTHNIIVDGKGTSCWVDRGGRIGSLDKGGPTMYQWLRWFRVQPKECVDILKRLFPELERK